MPHLDHQFGLSYITPNEVADHVKKHSDHILGVIGFGQQTTYLHTPEPVWVNIPVLGGSPATLEIWTSKAPVSSCSHNSIKGTCDGQILFGSLSLEQHKGTTLQALAKQAYTQIFEFIDHHSYPHLLRVWHYFPQINDSDDHGLERYRGFNVGRHDAFVANGRQISEESVPAASALGSESGSLTIYFMASKQPGKSVDNPRQVSAYNYPQSFGPRSPIFVRAMSVNLGGQQCFFISGTASIVGYETVHHGDVAKQATETLLNIRTLLQQEPSYDPEHGNMLLKIYLRNMNDLEIVSTKVLSEFGTRCRAIYLHSNICRSDLLLEIEGVYFNDHKQKID